MADEVRNTRSGAKLFWYWFERLGPLVMLLALVVGFSAVEYDAFVSVSNFQMILLQTAILATCTLGMTMIMVSGGLDLSVGSALAFASVSGAIAYTMTGSPFFACITAILAGGVVGSANGLLVAGCGMNPFIVTLGMMGVARGAARLFCDSKNVYLYHDTVIDGQEHRDTWVPQLLVKSPSAEPWATLGVSPGVVITIILIAVMIFVMRRTVLGRHVYAIGSNEDAARLCGIEVDRSKFMIYLIAGLIFGVAGMMQMAFDNSGNPTSRLGFELNVIAAVVIGGASLNGGQGTIFGSVVGALIMVVLTSGFNLTEVSAETQQLVIGVIIVAAVALDMLRQGSLKIPFIR